MPELDGFESAKITRITEQVTGNHQPIIAMTAHATVGDRELCLEAGMDEYVSKPIRVNELDGQARDRTCTAQTFRRGREASQRVLFCRILHRFFPNQLGFPDQL